MSEKKSCNQHEKFNYYCADCQEANRRFTEEQKYKKIQDAEEPPSRTRFKYKAPQKKPIRKKRKYLLIGLIAIGVIALIVSLWLWPSWIADISLQGQLYASKSGIDFYNVYFLNFWSTSFFFNKTALIGALIGCIIMSLPPDRNLLTLIGTKLRFGKPSYLKSLIFWWTAGFVIFYLLGFLIDGNGGFSWAMYLVETGEINLLEHLNAFDVLFNPSNTEYLTIFVYSNIILPILNFIFGVLIFRVVLNLIKNSYLKRNDYYLIANIFLLIGFLFGIWFFSLPTQALDGIGLIQVWSVILGFISFLTLGVLTYIYGRIRSARNANNYILQSRKKLGIVVVIIIVILVIPLFISIAPAITLNNTSVWLEQTWDKKIRREIEWTNDAAGLDMFEDHPILDYTNSTITPDAQMVEAVRQYDQDVAVRRLGNQIGSAWEGLADSDIVYINGKEYWVAPKTIKFSEIQGDSVQTNTELYDHVEGFLAMDSFTGDPLTPLESEIVFNISRDSPVFFGESESQKYLQTFEDSFILGALGAFDSDILLGTEWSNVTNNVHRYEGAPDGKLIGIENFWKKVNIGLFAYVFSGEEDFLVNRNVKTRVQNVLYPGLTIDNDPYLVFDSANGKLYYAVSIYTSINIGSYARSSVLRFLGVALIDVLDGQMTLYKSPSLDETTDPTRYLWQFYMNLYDWEDIMTSAPWLMEQLRYPEDLFEAQLRANYVYHVDDPSTWRREDDFHERPAGGDTFYIETDVGEGIEFAAIDLVKYQGRTATILAGMYLVRHGAHFGEAIFYYTRNLGVNLIGTSIANQTYAATATQEISLIANARNGNILLYPLAGAIYYFIPTYSTVALEQQLQLAGFIHAFTKQVGYGNDVGKQPAQNAYDALNITVIEPPSNLTLTMDFSMETSATSPNDPANFRIALQNTNLNFSALGLDVQVNLTVFTETSLGVTNDLILPSDMYPIENSTYTEIYGTEDYTFVNYTIVDTILDFGEGLVINGFLNASSNSVVVWFRWTVTVDGKVVYVSTDDFILFLP